MREPSNRWRKSLRCSPIIEGRHARNGSFGAHRSHPSGYNFCYAIATTTLPQTLNQLLARIPLDPSDRDRIGLGVHSLSRLSSPRSEGLAGLGSLRYALLRSPAASYSLTQSCGTLRNLSSRLSLKLTQIDRPRIAEFSVAILYVE